MINQCHLRQQLRVCPHGTEVTAWLWPEAPSVTATENQIFQRRYFHLTLPKIKLGIQVWEHSPLSCHKPTNRHKRHHNMCQIYIYTPTKQRTLCLSTKSSFATYKFQQRKRRTADKPSRYVGLTILNWQIIGNDFLISSLRKFPHFLIEEVSSFLMLAIQTNLTSFRKPSTVPPALIFFH